MLYAQKKGFSKPEKNIDSGQAAQSALASLGPHSSAILENVLSLVLNIFSLFFLFRSF